MKAIAFAYEDGSCKQKFIYNICGFLGRPPQSAVSGRLSSRHICKNPDLAGTLWTNSRTKIVAKQ